MKKESNKNIILLATLFFIASIFVSVPFCKADTKKTLYADRDYIDLKIDDREAKYILDIESKNMGAVDWIGYVSRLDLKEFDSSSDFYERVKDNRTIYTTEGEPLGIVYGEAKSLFRYFDVLSNAIGWAVNRVFGNKIEDTVTIPSDEKNLYLVRVYSGGWGKMVDPNEKSVVREEIYKGNERDKQAMVLNMGTATLDTLGIFIPFTNFVSDDLGEIVAAGFIKASRSFFEPDIVSGVPDLKDLLQITVESGEAMLIKTAEIIKKEATQNFFKFVIKNSKQLVEIVDLPEKISKGGKVVDRITQMLTVATPLETSYVVVGNPLLALEKEEIKREIPEIIEKGGPAALVLPSAIEERPKEEKKEPEKTEFKITGFVKDQHGEPVKNASFWLMNIKGERYGGGKTSLTGYLEIDTKSTPEGNYTLHIEKGDHDSFEKKIQISENDINLGQIVLNKWSKVTAYVVDQHGKPVSGKDVWLTDKQGKKYRRGYWGYEDNISETGYLETVPVPDGEYTLYIEMGSYEPLGYDSFEKKIQISENDINLGQIVLNKWSKVTAYVVDENGQVAKGVNYLLKDKYGEKHCRGGDATFKGACDSDDRTTDTGYLETGVVPDGEYTLCLGTKLYFDCKKQIPIQIKGKDISLGTIIYEKSEWYDSEW